MSDGVANPVTLPRHPGMDSRQAIVPVALRVNANLFQTDLCPDPVAMEGIRNASIADAGRGL
ncbi:MAG: hypothetical protein WCP01_00760 [Methylococcaceae bacterium]